MNKVSTCFCVLILSTAAFAQTQPASTTDAEGTRRAATLQEADNSNYGWIGLLGLAGLAGLMRRDRPEVRHVDNVNHEVPRENIRRVS